MSDIQANPANTAKVANVVAVKQPQRTPRHSAPTAGAAQLSNNTVTKDVYLPALASQAQSEDKQPWVRSSVPRRRSERALTTSPIHGSMPSKDFSIGNGSNGTSDIKAASGLGGGAMLPRVPSAPSVRVEADAGSRRDHHSDFSACAHSSKSDEVGIGHSDCDGDADFRRCGAEAATLAPSASRGTSNLNGDSTFTALDNKISITIFDESVSSTVDAPRQHNKWMQECASSQDGSRVPGPAVRRRRDMQTATGSSPAPTRHTCSAAGGSLPPRQTRPRASTSQLDHKASAGLATLLSQARARSPSVRNLPGIQSLPTSVWDAPLETSAETVPAQRFASTAYTGSDSSDYAPPVRIVANRLVAEKDVQVAARQVRTLSTIA